MNDKPHEKPTLPDDAVEDLAPDTEADAIRGGAQADFFLKLDGVKGESSDQ